MGWAHGSALQGGQTNPYIGSLLDDCSPAFKEPVYGLFRTNPNFATFVVEEVRQLGRWLYKKPKK